MAMGRCLRRDTYDIFLDIASAQSLDFISWRRIASWLRIPRRRIEMGIHPLSRSGSSTQNWVTTRGTRGIVPYHSGIVRNKLRRGNSSL